jgi:hypothetical protein
VLHPLPNTGKDNAPYHHKRSFLSFSAMKTKKDLIEAMVGVGVKKVTLPVKEGVLGNRSGRGWVGAAVRRKAATI